MTGANGRHPLPTPEARRRDVRPARHRARQAGRRLRPGRRRVRGAAVVDAALARLRCGGGARRRLREVDRRGPRRQRPSRSPAPAHVQDRARDADRERHRRHGEPGAPDAAARRCARARALSRRDRTARSGRRPHSRRAQSSVHAKPQRRRHVQARGLPARGIRRGARRRPAGPGRAPVRLGRHRMPQHPGDGNRRHGRHAPLSRLVERMVRRPVAARRDGSGTRSPGARAAHAESSTRRSVV